MKEPVYPAEFLRKYEVLSVLGEGGVGRVVLARDLALDRKVAVKFLLDGAFATRSDLDRFAEEARVVAKLSHPNIVPLYSVGGADSRTPHLIFAYVDGDDISARIRGAGRLGSRETVQWMKQVLSGLAHAHENGIVHRDIKPNNVRINVDGQAMIMDFGMAKARSGRAFQTRVGLVLGTPLYIAPEILKGQPATPLSDLYSVGCTLYECLTGRPPHIAEDPMKVLEMQLKVDPEELSVLRPDLPAPLCEVVHRALKKDPESRHRSAAALAEALERGLSPQRSDASLRRVTRPRGPTGTNARLTPRAGPTETIAIPAPARPSRTRHALVALAVLAGAAGAAAVAWRMGATVADPGLVRVAIDGRGMQVKWTQALAVPVRVEVLGATPATAAEALVVAPDAPPRVTLPVPVPGRHQVRLSDPRGTVLWERAFTVPERVEAKVDFLKTADSPARRVRVELPAGEARRANLLVATADGDGQAPLAGAEAEQGHLELLADVVEPLSKLRVDLELADGVTFARILDENELRLLRFSALLERVDTAPLAALVRNRQVYDAHAHWLSDMRFNSFTPDNFAFVLAKGLASRAPRGDQLQEEADRLVFKEPLREELAWFRVNQKALSASPEISLATRKRFYTAVLRTIEPRDRLLSAQYRTHEPLSLVLSEPTVTARYTTPPSAKPAGDAIPLATAVKCWRDRAGLVEDGFATWSITYPHMKLAFGPDWAQQPDAQLSALEATRSYPVTIPPAWRAGRVTLTAEVAIMPPQYAFDVEIRGHAPGDVLPLRLFHPGNPVWYLVADGWPKRAAKLIDAAQFLDPSTRAETAVLDAKTVEQTMEWSTIELSFPGAWLPVHPEAVSMTYALPLGLKPQEMCPRQRAMFTRRITLGANP